MGRNEMVKHFVFQNYVGMAVAVATIAIGYIVTSVSSGREGLIATTVGGALGFCYFAQKQKLEELRLFKDLFTDFNCRYDDLNAELEDIRAGDPPCDPEQRKTLVDYFNLCAEEYLFYEEGYIHPKAWRSWCRGMMHYFENGGIRKVWDEEASSDSYYGLTLDTIRKGAGRVGTAPENHTSGPPSVN